MPYKTGSWGEQAKEKYKQRSKLRLEYFRKYAHQKALLLRKKAMALLGGSCVGCGYNKDYRALFIDHVNSGGTKLRVKYGTVVHLQQIIDQVEKGSSEYQILCANCNWLKRYEKNEHNQYTLVKTRKEKK